MTAYAELQVTSNFSFLRGASHPEELVRRAKELGHAAIAIADRNTLAGIVRAHVAAKEVGIRLVVGARLDFAADGAGERSVLCFPTDHAAYGRLSRLISLGQRRADKGSCRLELADLFDLAEGQIVVALPPAAPDPGFAGHVQALRVRFGKDCYLAAQHLYRGDDAARLARLADLAHEAGVRLVATNDVHAHDPGRRPLLDVLTCIREHCTIDAAGRRLFANAERHLKPLPEMARLFRRHPDGLAASLAIAERCRFGLDELRYEYPAEGGQAPQAELAALTRAGATVRYPDGVPAKVEAQLDHELALIDRLGYAPYFLTVHDIVRFARARGILCQGRGSAANSAVCYCLGITAVDPARLDLLFERFISAARNEPPDIDVDFEHERREEVMQYVYERYGRHRAGIAATVIHYRQRSAVREVGKALGLTEDVTARLSGTVWGGWGGKEFPEKHLAEAGLDPGDPRIEQLKELIDQLLNFPRHLSQHVGGFVLTEDRLDETVPIHHGGMEDRSFIEWDKDDIDALGLMKVDVLALGMLTCIRKSFDLMRRHGLGEHDLKLDLKADDESVYDMLCKGDSIGVFQVESRAQINMLPRLRPRTLYDLTIQVAIVRPGPIEGDMVHPYLRRRNKEEAVHFPSPAPEHGPSDELRDVLGKTMGVPLFQEQAMRLAIVAAKFSNADANRLRRAMATFRNLGTIDTFRDKMVGGMVRRGYEGEFAERCFRQIEGFGSYGFPESHALSFARLVYVSSWIKCHHPAVFTCALLNSQPMGFYAPAQLVRDAIEHGVKVLAADIGFSDWDSTLEGEPLALRLGLRQIDGFKQDWAEAIMQARAQAPFVSIEDLARRARLPSRALRLLADADAFGSLDSARRDALWEVRRTPPDQLPLFAAADAGELAEEEDACLPAMPPSEEVVADYQTTRLSLKGHPMQFLRDHFRREGALSCTELEQVKDGHRARAAGVVLIRQRPGKGNAIFITLEDETGIVNVLLWARELEKQRRAVMASRLMMVDGVVQKSKEGVLHLMASRVIDATEALDRLSDTRRARPELSRSDAVLHPEYRTQGGHPRKVRILPKSRDFH
ncbi:MAG: error-prone DNA polymerase [Pseudomonadota bacterium]